MSIFCYKKLAQNDRLGYRLEKKRQNFQISIAEMSERTHIAPKYILALEKSRFGDLPKARAYRLAYVREYAAALGLDPFACLEQFSREDGFSDAPNIHPHKTIHWLGISSLSLWLRNLSAASGAILFAGYLLWQVNGVLQPPDLAVYSPLEGLVLHTPNTSVQGETEPESRLTVNGQDIMVNEQGRFDTKVDLSNGINTIVITAAKKHGKTTTVTRHLVVQEKNKNEKLTLNNNILNN